MRNLWNEAPAVLLGVTLAAASPGAAAAQGFEGVVTYQMHVDRGPGTMTVTTKGSKARIEVSQGQSPIGNVVMLVDAGANTRTVIMPAMKRYMVLPPAAGGTDATIDLPKFTATKTGRTETVAGESCNVIHVSSVRDGKTEEGDICVAKGLGFTTQIGQAMMAGKASVMDARMASLRDVIGPGGGLLKMTSIKNGQPEVELVATKVERKSVSDDQFTPPADYTTMQLPHMQPGSPGAQLPPQ